MFETMKVKQLKALISHYRTYHNIKGYSRMKRNELVAELEKRFVIKDGQLYMKPQMPEPVIAVKVKKRITPALVGQLPAIPTPAFGTKKYISFGTNI